MTDDRQHLSQGALDEASLVKKGSTYASIALRRTHPRWLNFKLYAICDETSGLVRLPPTAGQTNDHRVLPHACRISRRRVSCFAGAATTAPVFALISSNAASGPASHRPEVSCSHNWRNLDKIAVYGSYKPNLRRIREDALEVIAPPWPKTAASNSKDASLR